MKKFPSTAISAFFLFPLLAVASYGQTSKPVAEWSFDETAGAVAHDSASGEDDAITGIVRHVDGVTGHGLRFDGTSTVVTRKAKRAPHLTKGLTVDTWLAIDAYPWNWVPIVDHRSEEQAGYFFGIDSFGHVGLMLAVNGQWWSLFSTTQIPLKKWSHIAGTYDPAKGMAIYLDGKPVGELSVQGPLSIAEREDLVIGRVRQETLPAQWIHPKLPVWFSFDGILDNVRIFDYSLAPAEIATAYADVHVPSGEVLPWALLPAGPAGAGRFGGFYTTLKYSEMWDAPRRVAPDSDVVVRFDQAPIRLVFWQGANYTGDWVTENGKWYTDEFLETGGKVDCPGGEDCEPMSDKQNRYSHVRIVENSDARTVVHWRYGLCEVQNFTCANPDPATGWTDWADEYFTVYPDGVAVRKQVLWTSNFTRWHEFQETIIINGPGTRPEDNIEPAALTLGNMKGETKTYSWSPVAPKKVDGPEEPNIQVVNLKSQWKPFQIVSPVKSRVTTYTGELTYSMFEWWNHWPVAQVKSSGISAVAPDRPSHSSLSHIYWEPYAQTENSMTKIMLDGLTTKSAAELVPLANSWLSAPAIEVSGQGFQSEGYDQTQRAYVLTRQAGAPTDGFRSVLKASPVSPLVNVAIVIKNWGDANPKLVIDGKVIPQGAAFRYGHINKLEGTDLVVWTKLESTKPTTFALSPSKK
jgi:Concanavalin A-like lectin/glucanases superfamily